MSQAATQLKHPFIEKFQGRFIGILRWEQLDEIWKAIQSGTTDDWYIYHIGDPVPLTACKSEQLHHFVEEMDKLLRQDHAEDYCGIVYVDDKASPAFVKIYDPHNLGHVCGSSGAPPPLPGWILSKLQPIDLQAAMPPTGNRKKWWQKIFN